MKLQNDRTITISTGESRKALFWKEEQISVGDLWERLKNPPRGDETLSEYMALKKAQQDDLKDVGGFVGGTLKGGRRKQGMVLGRDLIALDLDSIPSDSTDVVLFALKMTNVSWCVYSTRKHQPEAPRLRILFPLSRTVSADEYEPIARWMADQIKIEWADPTTFEANRLMFWPSCCADGEYVFRYEDAPLLNPDEVLGSYTDWRDVSEWPQVPGADNYKRGAAKQGDPDSKSGVVGAFNRFCGDIQTALDKFLPGAYEPVIGDDNRFTYTGGSTKGGAVLYDHGKFLYSYHATDPCSGKLVNCFDLVRLHKFGSLDENAQPGTPGNKMPSYLEMCKFAGNIPAIHAALEKERHDEAVKDFEEVASTEDPAPPTVFHKLSAKGVPVEILDANIEEYIIRKNDLFFLNGKPYLYDHGCFKYDEDGKSIKRLIRELIIPELVNANRIERVYRLFLSDSRISIDEDEINKYPEYWINFKNGMLDVKTGEVHEHSKEYRSINQIPHTYDPTADFAGSAAERFLRGLIPDPDDYNMFLAFIGVCMTRDTHFQKFLVLSGPGGIGKSTAAGLVLRVIGKQNTSGVPLQKLNERFQSVPLMYKLLNVSTDIPATSMSQTSVIRLMTGEDPVHAEFKGGKSFDFENYARLLFSANEMPAVLSEDPAPYYRRLMVIEAKKGAHVDHLRKALIDSTPGFIAECVRRLQTCYIIGTDLDSPNSKRIVAGLLLESDSTIAFISEYTEKDPNGKIKQKELYDKYKTMCFEREWRPKSNQRFYNSVRGLGYASRKSDGKDWFIGIRYKEIGIDEMK
ncbi:MAG: hypothetical protein J6E40_03355 [Lachnospiraceae bacterium]|nr:hypothetical protein [Lachnospiraceae bacterium]